MARGKRKRCNSPSLCSSSEYCPPRRKRQKREPKFLLTRLRRVELLKTDKDFDSLYELNRVEGKLGFGSFASVYICTDVASGISYACKAICKEKLYEMPREMRHLTYNEAACFTEVLPDHDNIVKVYKIYESPSSIYIIMELLAKNTLADTFQGYTNRNARTLFKKIVQAVKHLHDYGVVHNDLNIGLKNICFRPGEENCPVIIDLNMCTYLPNSATKKKPGFVMDQVFSATELRTTISQDILEGETSSFDDDLRSLGKILSVLLTGQRQPTNPPKYKPGSHPEAMALLRLLLDDEQRKKITLEQILNHPWFQARIDPDPTINGSRSPAKNHA